jgi:hydrogenase-4 component F
MTTLLLAAPIALPALGVLAYAIAGRRRAARFTGTGLAGAGLAGAGLVGAGLVGAGLVGAGLVGAGFVGAGCAAGQLAAGIALAAAVGRPGAAAITAGPLRADALSAYMVVVIGAVALLATAASPAYLQAELDAGRATPRTIRQYGLLVQAFLAAMALAVLAANLGVLWVAMEATTFVTAFLVGQRRTRTALEAAWKYVVICSAGIALAFLGTVLLNFAAAHAPTRPGLDWAALASGAAGLDPGVTRIAVALLVIGFGTKAGLAPLHAWLPDAHSQAPAPVSALMSGVLLSVAFYAVLRIKVIADAALGIGFARTLLAVIALATLTVAASLLLAQRDYKRMLAYSSIEHMGLLALGAAAGSRLAIAAVLLHVLGHGLAKAVLFLGSGRILQTTGTSLIGEVSALAGRQPVLAACFGLGVAALVGFPPFSLFASELGIARAGFATGLGWVTTAALLLMLVIAAAMFGHTGRMLLGAAPAVDGPAATRVWAADGPGAASAPPRLPVATATPMLAGLAACAALGLAGGGVQQLLLHAADALMGAP